MMCWLVVPSCDAADAAADADEDTWTRIWRGREVASAPKFIAARLRAQ